MRILLTTHAFLPRSVAGVEVYTARLAAGLERLGHTVRILTAVHDLGAKPHAVRRKQPGGLDVVEIVNPHLEGTLEATYRLPGIDASIARVFEEFRPECVHAQHLLNLSTGLFDSAAAVGAPVVFTLHDYWLSCPRDGLRMRKDGALCTEVDHRVCASCMAESPYLVSPLQKAASHAARWAKAGSLVHALHRLAPGATVRLIAAMRRLWPARQAGLEEALRARADHLHERENGVQLFLAPTAFARDRAVEWGIPTARVRVAFLGAVFGPTRPRPAGERPRIAYIGTLAPHKGVHVLIEAVLGLGNPGLTLEIVGNPAADPSYFRHLQLLAARDARIRFRGAVGEGEQARVLASVDVLALPSLWWENSPIAVLEALAAGVPVVASRTGGVGEILPEAAGVLVPPGDVPALREALRDVVEGRLLGDPLGALPLKTVHDGARELAALYAELVEQGGPRR